MFSAHAFFYFNNVFILVPKLMCVMVDRYIFSLQIPAILSHRHEYRIYTADVIFQNNWDIENPRKTV